MTSRRKYLHPPLLEAVCEFRFEPESPWDLTIPGLVYDRLKDQFPIKRSAPAIALGLLIGDSNVERRIEHGTRMQFVASDDSLLVQVDENLISINHLRPYPGWDAFRPTIARAYQVYSEVAHPRSISRMGVRYINRIELQGPRVELEDYLNFYPHLGPKLPQDYGSFIAGISSSFSEGRDGMRMQINNVPSEAADGQWFLLDVDYFLAAPASISFDAALDWIDDAHTQVEELFEGCITDELRSQFGIASE